MVFNSIKKTFNKYREDINDLGRNVAGHHEEKPEYREEGKALSRKQTGLRRHERARHMTDDHLKEKYQTSCQKMVKNGAAVFGAETVAIGAAKVAHAPLSVEKAGTAGGYSVKAMKQAVRAEVWRQELRDRGYVPAFGLVGPPNSMDELKQAYQPYKDAAMDGFCRGAVKGANKEMLGHSKDEYTSLPMNEGK